MPRDRIPTIKLLPTISAAISTAPNTTRRTPDRSAHSPSTPAGHWPEDAVPLPESEMGRLHPAGRTIHERFEFLDTIEDSLELHPVPSLCVSMVVHTAIFPESGAGWPRPNRPAPLAVLSSHSL